MSELLRRELLKLLAGASMAPVLMAAGCRLEASPWDEAALIRSQIKLPDIPGAEFSILDFGAVGDGRTDCSQAIAETIAAASAKGGGRVTIPPGVYLTGPMHLQNHINLHIEEGATLSFIPEPDRYLPAVFTRWEGMEFMGLSPLIYAYGKTDLAVTGKGILNGGADETNWWPWANKDPDAEFSQTPARTSLFAESEAGIPPEDRLYAEGAYLRPPFIQFYHCSNILIEGVTITHAPFWLINPVLCNSVTLRGVTCISYGPNNDGCDPESSKDVLIEDCVFDTGDDCIAIKSGRNADGRRVNVASENIVVSNCEMKAGHGGVVMGSELSGGIRNVFVENCRMSSPDLWSCIRIKTNAMRGGGVENLNVRKLDVGTVRDIVLINFYYEEGEDGPHSPVVQNLSIEDVHVELAERVLNVRGFDHAPIKDLKLANIIVEKAELPSIISNVNQLVLENVRINGSSVKTAEDLQAESPA
ncbi:MAG TPA: glycoside hydrolase family 28 protein [Xanthomonadales bacterium]|nr:glycoside hydrolase family 28 protein [Xanthomonadales bacterium]